MRVPNTEDDVIFQYKDGEVEPAHHPGRVHPAGPGGVLRRYVECKD